MTARSRAAQLDADIAAAIANPTEPQAKTLVRGARKPSVAALQRLARRAWVALDRFKDALEKAKEHPDWERIAGDGGMSPDADADDWMS